MSQLALPSVLGRHADVARPSVIGEITQSPAGNVIVRVGRQNRSGPGWSVTEHVVLTPQEARALVDRVAGLLDDDGGRS